MAVFSSNSILTERCGDSQKNVENNFDFRTHILISYDQSGNQVRRCGVDELELLQHQIHNFGSF
jgi:hypothetical protein